MISPGPLRFLEVITEEGENTRLWGDVIRFVSLDGVGLPPIRRFLTYAPLQHGAIDRGWRYDPRKMTLTLYIEGLDMAHAARIRDRLARTFSPATGLLTLQATRDDGAIRCIDCFVDGEVDFPQSETVGQAQTVVIQLVAPDPSFYDPAQQSQSTTFDASSKNINVPITGLTWPVRPIIDVTGPTSSSFVISQNFPSGNLIGPGVAIPGGETWRFDLQNYTITRLSDGENQLLATGAEVFKLPRAYIRTEKITKAWGTLLSAFNVYAFTSTGANGAPSGATITYTKRYASL